MNRILRFGTSLLVTHWVWLVPSLVLVLISPWSLTNFDSTRDFIVAHRIIDNFDLPVLGPLLAFSFHIGPWWYYVMALPILLTGSWLGMAIMVALLNSLKFLLAFRIGCLIKDKMLGQLLVLVLLLVSLTYMQTVTFTHTSVVETCMLLMLYVTVKTKLLTPWHWMLFGLCTGLAFHSHPTAILIGFFALFPWFSGSNKGVRLLTFLIGLVLIVFPMLYQEFTTTSDLSSGMGSYFDQQSGGLNLMDLPALWYGLLFSGPMGILTINLPNYLIIIIIIIQLMIQAAALTLPWLVWQSANDQIKRWYLHSWAFFILSSIGILLIRDRTPWYMTYGLSLSFSLVVAFGLSLAMASLLEKFLAALLLVFRFSCLAHLLTWSIIILSYFIHNTCLFASMAHRV